ncbi:MAG: DUF4239 domain-containing protein [Methylacidiphilales bacterium]|nr:DUF4239 domain-containing protein [Candidatus Methylacidiphilales bacterium]
MPLLASVALFGISMEPLTISLISFASILGGALFGFFFARVLPEHHLGPDSKDAVKMGWGIVATMSALVLSLLVASAKNTFDTVNSESTETSAKLIMLNHTLVEYGSDADAVRNDLRTAVASAIRRDWSENPIDTSIPAAAQHSNVMQGFNDELNQLVPKNDDQRALLAKARQLTGDLCLERWLIIEQSKNSLPPALIIALVFWLTILFLGLGLFSPNNKTVLMMLVLCSLSVSVAIFLINDMSHPLRGLISVSSASMLDVWNHLNQP